MTPEEGAYQLVTGGRSLRGEHRASVPERMSELERAAGSKQGAARLAGVAPRTWRDWRAGAHAPSRASAERLRGAVRRSRVPARREARLRGFTGTISIKGRFLVSSDERDRTLKLTRSNVPAGAHQLPARIVDRVLLGTDAAAGDSLVDLVSAYQPGMIITRLDRVSSS